MEVPAAGLGDFSRRWFWLSTSGQYGTSVQRTSSVLRAAVARVWCAVLRWFASPDQPPRKILAQYTSLWCKNTKNGRFAPALARARNVVPERKLQSNLVCMHLKCVRMCYVASPALPGAPLIKWRINDPNKKTSPAAQTSRVRGWSFYSGTHFCTQLPEHREGELEAALALLRHFRCIQTSFD